MRWFLIILLMPFISEAQVKTQPVTSQANDTLVVPSVHSSVQRSPITKIFQNVEYGLQNNAVDKFKKELGEIVSMTISSGEHGYYSANQAVLVLVGYFSERRLVSFKFSRIQEKDFAPYATGRFIYVQKGMQKSAQVYVSLTRQDSQWVISQFNIY
ncbi:MAG: DUF4783 domain-containing protein [Bacteroidota bacterium]